MSNRFTDFIALMVLVMSSCQPMQPAMFLGQGTMVGEVTERSAILQSRLTATEQLTDGDLPGAGGWARFSWWIDGQSNDTIYSRWLLADSSFDHIVKVKINQLVPNSIYHYRVDAVSDTMQAPLVSASGQFRTLPGAEIRESVSAVVVTGMNYYFFHYGNYDRSTAYQGADKYLGFPALGQIEQLGPDYFIGTGDNVYFDHPAEKNYEKALEKGLSPLPGLFHGKEVVDRLGMRKKYHVQWVQPRFKRLFAKVGTYWEKDDHDYRVNDGDPYTDFPISHELGIENFREQLPVADPLDPEAKTYRTHRMTQDLQVWFLEGRDYRSANAEPDSDEKTIWGTAQKNWLKETLLASDATFKIIVSPTPMVGPDDASKRDNHVNPRGFRREGEAFFQWLHDNLFSPDSLFFVCGDRHWQYHAVHPTGFQEFSCGALVDANSRAGRLAGDPKSTDPEAIIEQRYVQGTKAEATGGFLLFEVKIENGTPHVHFHFYDEQGNSLYTFQT